MTIASQISDVEVISLTSNKAKFEDKYCLGSRLGSGSFASVYRCEEIVAEGDVPSQEEKACLAVKVFDWMTDPARFSAFRLECKILRSIPTHENCIKMHDAFEESRYCYLVMEKCTVNLRDALQRDVLVNQNAGEHDLAHVFKSMLTGVDHLHKHGIVHRDVKPENILLAQGRTLSGKPTIKICDMGLAAKLPAGGSLTEVCGSQAYMAPEMLNKKGYGTSVDVWSCGVVAYTMVLGVHPYGEGCLEKRELARLMCVNGVLPDFKAHNGFQTPSVEAVQFLGVLLDLDPVVRLSAEKALTSPYLNSSTLTTLAPSTSPALASSASPTLRLVPRFAKKPPGGSSKSIIAALSLEMHYGVNNGVRRSEGLALRRQSDDAAGIKAAALHAADDVRKSPTPAGVIESAGYHNTCHGVACAKKFEDAKETRVSL